MSELVKCIIVLIISAIIGIAVNSFFNNFLIVIGIVFVCTGGAVIILMKDKNNQSLADTIMQMFKFMKSQKFYDYEYKSSIEIRRN